MQPDGLHTPEIAAHSLEKIRRHNYYAALFSKALRAKWKNRLYIGLYAGAGRAQVKGSGEVVETTALAVFRQEVPFTKYIFVDSDERCIRALEARLDSLGGGHDVTFIQEKVNDAVPQILSAIPSYNPKLGEGLIGLCFVDPFRVDLDFEVIRRLGRYRMDFLVMLPLGYDLRRNLRRYLENADDDRVGALIDDPDWRPDWRGRELPDRRFVRFVLEKFDQAMERLGYRRRKMEDTVSVKVKGMEVYLYSLALYTKHPLGEQFWKTTVVQTDPQMGLGL